MNDQQKDKLVMEALLERFQKQRLTRVLDIKNKVELGKKLDRFDMEFLQEIFNDARQNEHLIESADDDAKMLCTKVLSLYKEITLKALENEQRTDPY